MANPSPPRRWYDGLRLIVMLSLVLAMQGCGVLNLFNGTPSDATTSPGAAMTPTDANPTPEAEVTPTAESPAEGENGTGEVVLTAWMPESLAPTADTSGGQQLLAQFAAFEERHPDIQIETYAKLTTGEGSTLNYLRSAPSVAPDVLPDIALVDQEALMQSASEGLIVPLADLINPALVEGLYPAAVELGTIDGELVGLPYTLQMQHLVYRETLFDDPPHSFSAVLESPVPYIFPAGTMSSVNRTTLTQYLAGAGSLVDDEGQPTLDVNVLTDVLTFYAEARDEEVIDPVLLQMSDPAVSWEMFNGRQAGLSTVTSTAYLTARETLRSTGVTWVPTADGQPYALISGWMWVIVTEDPDRQAAAVTAIETLMDPVNQGTYAEAANWLPSQPSALAVWGDDDAYAEFADQVLEQAAPLPDSSLRLAVGEAMQDAVTQVLLDGTDPFQAASQAAQSVNAAAGG